MARKRATLPPGGPKTTDYRHTAEKRTNIPPAKIEGEGVVPVVPKVRYYYNPHLTPTLRFDTSGAADAVQALVEAASQRLLTVEEQVVVSEAIHHYQPWLEWAGKREQQEKGYFERDPVALHIHERVSAKAIVRAAMREDVQKDLFADPHLPYQEVVQFYQHDVAWANRLILGDSLQVMSSLGRREGLSGKVQMIYMDPPYGIKFASNFQPQVKSSGTVKDRDADLIREAEVVRAYRDTWSLGTHSYLGYLRERLLGARELLAETGSLFVQINEVNLHRVRTLLDEVFGSTNFVSQITYRTKNMTFGGKYLETVADHLVWYAKDKSRVKYHQLFRPTVAEGDSHWNLAEYHDGRREQLSREQVDNHKLLPQTVSAICQLGSLYPAGINDSGLFGVSVFGKDYHPPAGKSWKTTAEGLQRVIAAERVAPYKGGETIRYVMKLSDYPVSTLSSLWNDTPPPSDKRYVVQTSDTVVERCVLMTTDPGDLVLDPTCGSGTTAFVSEKWGRRWIGIDTSRVSIAIARQRLLTQSRFDYFRLQQDDKGPRSGFVYETVPHITLGSIANNQNLDPIFNKHAPILDAALAACNKALKRVPADLVKRLATKLEETPKDQRTEAVRRRLALPATFEHWTMPFDTDPDWPSVLQDTVVGYRKAWRQKMDEVDECISNNAEQEHLVDRPEVVKRVLRVSGAFTVEGVRPEAPGPEDQLEIKNVNSYLVRMVQHLRADGITFLGNKQKSFARIEPLFEAQTGSVIHAEGIWEGADLEGPNPVAVGFGPQYGPVTALQVEELIRAAKRYDEIVIAGFSFDAEATEVIQTQAHPNLRIHQAYIRPDINPGMEGLLKDTPNSQLFTVFGQPEVEVKPVDEGEWVVRLVGVDIYDPIENQVRSSGAEKVAAWFLDSDYDGRCFCITQAFFPNQAAWAGIARTLGSSADEEAFDKFSGTESIPFKAGRHKRVAVKVIDPRGNEVMSVQKLEP